MKTTGTTADSAEVRYFEEWSGLGLQVPGFPSLGAASEGHDSFGLVCRGIIAVGALPVTLRVLVADVALDPQALTAYVQSYLKPRTDSLPRIHRADAALRTRLGVAAAASALYRLSQPTAAGEDAEEVLVLCRGRQVVVLSKQFAVRRMPAPSWALFNAVLNASLGFSAAPPVAPLVSVWPSSDFLLPGVAGTLTPEATARATVLGRSLANLTAPARKELVRRGARLLTGSEPPSTPFSAEDQLLLTQFLADACQSTEQEELLTTAIAQVRTSGDVRGLAILLLTALAALTTPETAGTEALDVLSLYAN